MGPIIQRHTPIRINRYLILVAVVGSSGSMPSISLKKPVYDALVRNGEEPADVANQLCVDHLEDEHGVSVEVDI